ncbi:hypothetical protein METHPM2_70098 [Pseudomonas sp. PM2]
MAFAASERFTPAVWVHPTADLSLPHMCSNYAYGYFEHPRISRLAPAHDRQAGGRSGRQGSSVGR